MAFDEEGHLRVQSRQDPPLDPGITRSQVFSVGGAVYREPRVPSKIVRLARIGVHCQPQVAVPDRGLHAREPRCPVTPQGPHDPVTVALKPFLNGGSQSGLGLPEVGPCHRHLIPLKPRTLDVRLTSLNPAATLWGTMVLNRSEQRQVLVHLGSSYLVVVVEELLPLDRCEVVAVRTVGCHAQAGAQYAAAGQVVGRM